VELCFSKTLKANKKTASLFLKGAIKILGTEVFLRMYGNWKHTNSFMPDDDIEA